MSEPIQQGTGEALGAEDLRPFLEDQVYGQYEAVMLIGSADDLEKQFGPPALEKGTYPHSSITRRWSLWSCLCSRYSLFSSRHSTNWVTRSIAV